MTAPLKVEPQPEIQSLPSFVSDLCALRDSRMNRKFWYRGQSSARHELIPTIGRKDIAYAGRTMNFSFREEWEMLHRFRRRTYLEFGRLLSAGEALFVARHHGLPTRLLDWTANALYGLYFACYQAPEEAAQLWALTRRDRSSVDVTDGLELTGYEDELKLFKKLDGRDTLSRDGAWDDRPRLLKLLEPPYNSRRLLAQDGVFTFHNCPHRPITDFVGLALSDADLDFDVLYSWPIPRDAKPKLIAELSGLGITYRSVFPDLDGIARSLWETQVLWHDNRRSSLP
jgi:hypothetical protein